MSDNGEAARSAAKFGTGLDKPLIKRFYKSVTVDAVAAGNPGGPVAYRVLLDGRGVRTPAKRPLAVPVEKLAEVIAAEWRAQGDTIEPGTMHVTRLVNTALDGVTGRESEVRASIVHYAGSDLLCYRAEGPYELAERQSRRWGAILDWADETLGLSMVLAAGIMPVVQPAQTIAKVARALEAYDSLQLAALHDMTTLTGSVLLALATARRGITAQDAWSLAHLDEDYQIELWGADADAVAKRARRWQEMEAAEAVFRLVSTS